MEIFLLRYSRDPNAGPDGACRTVLLDTRGYVALLRLYLARAGYTSGPLFRASINGRGGPLSYDAAHNRWKKYRAAAGAQISIHQLRHAHPTSCGVSIEVVRRRLGHASTETTQVTPCSPTRSPTPRSARHAANARRDADDLACLSVRQSALRLIAAVSGQPRDRKPAGNGAAVSTIRAMPDELPVDVFTELGRVTWAAIKLEDYVREHVLAHRPREPANRQAAGQ